MNIESATSLLRQLDKVDQALQNLQPREQEVLRLLARGYTNQEIAEKLQLKQQATKNYILTVSRKLGLRRRAHVIAFAIKFGVVSIDDIIVPGYLENIAR